MLVNKKTVFSTNQFIWLIFAGMPVGISTLPREINKHAQQSGWMFIIIVAIFVILFSRFGVILFTRYPQQSIVSISECIMGKILGKLLSLYMILSLMITSGLGVRLLADGLVTYLLFHTPEIAIILSMLVVVFYAVCKGAETIARFNEVIQPLILLSALSFLLSIPKADLSNFLPLLSEQISISKAMQNSVYPYAVLFFIPFLFPYLKDSKQLGMGMVAGISLIGFSILWPFVFSIALFGATELNYINYPTIEIARIVDFPFLERMEIVHMVVWIPIGFTLHTLTAFTCTLGFTQCFPKISFLSWSGVTIGLIALVAILPNDIEHTRRLADIFSLNNSVIMFLIFPILVLWDTLKKWRSRYAVGK